MSRFRVQPRNVGGLQSDSRTLELNNYYLIIFRDEVQAWLAVTVVERARSLLLPKELANGLSSRFVKGIGKS